MKTPSKTSASSSYEGKQDHIRDLTLPAVEVFRNIYADRDYTVEMCIPEFTSVCPKTGLPDFGEIAITYVPNTVCLELKSLKEYIISYRNLGIFQENIVNRILDDLVRCCKPRWMRVSGRFNVRGGIGTSVTAEYPQTKKRPPR